MGNFKTTSPNEKDKSFSMSKWNVIIKEKYARYKQHGIREVFKKEDGAIDLASVMVGVIVIGVIGGIIATTIFAVIPWAQDNAAKQQLDSIVQAENAYFGLSAATPSPLPAGTPANSFGKSADLKTANLLTDHPRYCATTPDDKKSYTGYSQSSSGKIWTVSDKNSKATPFADSSENLPSDCKFIAEGFNASTAPEAPYIDPTPTKTILTFKCDTTTAGRLPISTGIKGSETWSDGVTVNQTGQSYPIGRTLTGGVSYQVVFDGTYQRFTSESPWAKCLRSVDHWGSASGVTNAIGAFSGDTNLTDVPAHIPTTITSMGGMFQGATALNDPDISKWNVSNVTDMNNMFNGATAFNQPLNQWDVSNVTLMKNMFENAPNFNQPLNDWNTSKVTSIAYMFRNASSFNQPLNDWSTANVTNMHMVFFGAPYQQDLSSWDMNKVTKMAFMFNNPDVFDGNVQRKGTPITTKMRFRCDVTTTGSAPLSTGITGTETWNDGATNDNGGNPSGPTRTLQAGVDYTGIFEGTYYYLQTAPNKFDKCLRSIDYWGSATNARGAQSAFAGATNLTNVPDSIPTTMTTMTGMFNGATNLNDPDISKWNVSNVTDMSNMFKGATSFNQPLNNWNVSKVTTMNSMFENASNFNQDLNAWDTASLTSAAYMFRNASSFNQPLNNWNTANVTDMHMMFFGAPYQQDLSSWDMNKVNRMAFMFNNPDVFDGNVQRTTHPKMTKMRFRCDVTTTGSIPLSTGVKGTETWNDGATNDNGGNPSGPTRTLQAGVDYTGIFEGTYYYLQTSSAKFDKCLRSVDYWGSATGALGAQSAFAGATNLTNVPDSIPTTMTTMTGMFNGATSLNDPDISKWDVSNVTDMSSMFKGATSFNQPLNSWNVSKVTTLNSMFENASSFNQTLNSWNTLGVTSAAYMFRGAANFNQPLNNWNTANVTDMHMMFFGAPYQQDLSSWNMNKVNRMAFMFSNPDSFNGNVQRTTHPTMTKMRFRCDVTTTGSIPLSTGVRGTETWSDGATNVNGGNPSGPTRTLQAGVDYTGIFEGTYYYLQVSSAKFDKCLRSVDYWGSATGALGAQSAFAGATNLTNVPDSIPTTITTMSYMFNGATSFNDPDVKNWDVSKVTNMSYMFNGAAAFNQDLSGWNTAVLTNGTFFAPASFPTNYLPPKTSK